MRSATRTFALFSLFALAASAVACAPAEEESVDDSEQEVTGGSSAIESPVVYLFDGAEATIAPKCAGALLGPKVAVTAKSCAKAGLFLGRAADKDGKGARAKVTAVHVPDGPDADIAVVEIDREIGGVHALITHSPLRDGYAVNSIASADGKGVFAPNKGEASSIVARMTSETEMHGTIFPAKGSEICGGDIGAPVCSSTATKIAGFNVRGTCGLSALVIGPEGAAPAQSAPNGPNVAGEEGGRERPAQEAPAAQEVDAMACSAGPWKVVQLGRHAEFLRQFAPEAFEPLVIDKPILRNLPYVPAGLWGHETGGTIAACKIETTKLDRVAAGAEAKLTAKVSFANMEARATPFGRFGIAPKSAPTKMRWLPARATTQLNGTSFDATFEGTVAAVADGDYVVGFRASATGGEAWTQCDLDGIENGFSAEKLLSLEVGAGADPAETPGETEEPGETKPQDVPAPAESSSDSSSDYSDPPSTDDDYDYADDDASDWMGDEEPTIGKKKKKASAGGCSAAPNGANASSGLPMLGILLGLAAFIRRRR